MTCCSANIKTSFNILFREENHEDGKYKSNTKHCLTGASFNNYWLKMDNLISALLKYTIHPIQKIYYSKIFQCHFQNHTVLSRHATLKL